MTDFSFELVSFILDTSEAARRNTEYFINIVNSSNSDIIVFPGWSITDNKELDIVRKTITNNKSIVFFEVWQDRPSHVYPHKGYAIQNGQLIDRNIYQYFSQSKEVDNNPHLIREYLEHAEKNRKFVHKGLKIFWMICGELNILRNLQGQGNKIEFRVDDAYLENKFIDIIKWSDIIIDPLHTPMGNQGKMHKRREFLSKNGKVYCSAANLPIAKASYDPKNKLIASGSLQYVYRDGNPLNGNILITNNDVLCNKFTVGPDFDKKNVPEKELSVYRRKVYTPEKAVESENIPSATLGSFAGKKVKYNPMTSYDSYKSNSATGVIYEYVKQKYPEAVDVSELPKIAAKCGYQVTGGYLRTVIEYAVLDKYRRNFFTIE